MTENHDINITAADIKEAMKRFGHTQADVAVVTGVGLRTLIRKLQEPGVIEFKIRAIGRSLKMYIEDSKEYEKSNKTTR